MAARRLSKSAIDWAAFAERVPKNQVDSFRAFKNKSDMFVSKVHRNPESLPAIDFAFYKSRLSTPALVDEFEKKYKALTVPYPKDPENMLAKIDAQEKDAAEKTKQFVAEVKQKMADAQALLNAINAVPGPDVMTLEMFGDYFPEKRLDPENKPSIWPHTPMSQADAPDKFDNSKPH